MRRHLLLGALGVLVLAYPLLVSGLPVYQRLGALVLLAAIGASAWNIVGGYAGQVSVGHSVFFGVGAYSAVVVYTHLGWPPIAAMSGVMMSAISAWTTALKATPMTTATARSMRLPRNRNFLKPLISPP